ncbi:putative signal peptide protein [Puccinia sorghi]|uniref:Putative signal peptide protein n=1 Tax=Puccinia sorghi TaxID=27349 RepID=A0A0L6U5D1_9BASI|nr:putative signal peptide protein [Puccinia sorghi]
MQHAPAKLSSKLHLFAYLDVLAQSLCITAFLNHSWRKVGNMRVSACQLQAVYLQWYPSPNKHLMTGDMGYLIDPIQQPDYFHIFIDIKVKNIQFIPFKSCFDFPWILFPTISSPQLPSSHFKNLINGKNLFFFSSLLHDYYKKIRSLKTGKPLFPLENDCQQKFTENLENSLFLDFGKEASKIDKNRKAKRGLQAGVYKVPSGAKTWVKGVFLAYWGLIAGIMICGLEGCKEFCDKKRKGITHLDKPIRLNTGWSNWWQRQSFKDFQKPFGRTHGAGEVFGNLLWLYCTTWLVTRCGWSHHEFGVTLSRFLIFLVSVMELFGSFQVSLEKHVGLLWKVLKIALSLTHQCDEVTLGYFTSIIHWCYYFILEIMVNCFCLADNDPKANKLVTEIFYKYLSQTQSKTPLHPSFRNHSSNINCVIAGVCWNFNSSPQNFLVFLFSYFD